MFEVIATQSYIFWGNHLLKTNSKSIANCGKIKLAGKESIGFLNLSLRRQVRRSMESNANVCCCCPVFEYSRYFSVILNVLFPVVCLGGGSLWLENDVFSCFLCVWRRRFPIFITILVWNMDLEPHGLSVGFLFVANAVRNCSAMCIRSVCVLFGLIIRECGTYGE